MGFLIGVKGDWKFEKEFFQQLRAWASAKVCCYDEACKSPEGAAPYAVCAMQ
jgi:predicted HicB family RNase H-like nuclease